MFKGTKNIIVFQQSLRFVLSPGADTTLVSTVLRKSVRFFIINIFNNNNNRTFKVEIWKMVWTNVFFFQFLGIRQKPGKGNFRDLKSQNIIRGAWPRAPLEACSLGPSFRKSVSIYPRSAPGALTVEHSFFSYQEYPKCSGFQAGSKDPFILFGICPVNQFLYGHCGVLLSFSLSVQFVICYRLSAFTSVSEYICCGSILSLV